MRTEELFPILDEQVSVGFTGKVNVLDDLTKRLLGSIDLSEGEVWSCSYRSNLGLKAFFNLCIDSFEGDDIFSYVVEPEILQSSRSIHYPYSVLKRKSAEVLESFKESKSLRPPGGLKLIVNPEFLTSGAQVEGDEYDLLCSIADYNKVEEIYKNCELLDYQITNALVSLRKKNALTVVKKG
ncbi:MAG: hypothetical protein KC478_03060 [Bacteriovoracaceae bacterium]|nr:hypothetical protein [Bacteriovoracaceae bacterium]